MSLIAARGGDDNVTAQIVHVTAVDDVWYYRGTPIHYAKDAGNGQEARNPGNLICPAT